MRTNIIIDDKLMQQVLQNSGYKTKKEAVHAGLQLLVQLQNQKKLKAAFGKFKWTGNLHKSRLDK